jgi:2,3,4,5-tetrahydropyridine-2-carboxylate N-succinyltransferase
MSQELHRAIEAAWEARESLSSTYRGSHREAVEGTLAGLDEGRLRAAEKVDGAWKTNEWVKKAILLSFRLDAMKRIEGGPDGASWFDRVDSKFLDWDEAKFRAAGFRAVPGAIVRRSAFIAKNAVLMPSFVNVGARVGEGTMIDTWATVGSCAQVGANCHISGGAGLGGVLEPLQASPTIIEDNCFIGARAEVAEGVVVGEGSVLSMGVYLSASTRIIDRATGQVHLGRVPPYSVVVSGSAPTGNNGGPNLYCAVIVKQVDEKTRAKTSINELLRPE